MSPEPMPFLPALPIDADRMHRADPDMVQVILSYVADRLLTPEVPLDGLADRDHLDQVIDGLITEEGHDFRKVLDVYANHLALTVLSADSPRMFTFIPSAPTKASLLFDMVVSAASLQGISWFEAAGAVMAENQVLRTLADIAGMPASAGGVFVSGGSAGNLSALVVARDTMRRRRAEAGLPDIPLRVVVSDQSHSSITNTLNITDDVGARRRHAGRRADRRRAAQRPRRSRRPRRRVRDRGHRRHHERGHHRRHRRGERRSRGSTAGGCTSTVPTAAPACSRRSCVIATTASSTPTRSSWTRTSGGSRPSTRAALLYRDPRLAKAVHTQDASYLDVIHEHDSDINPSDLAYHLTRRARGLPLWFSMAVNGIGAYREAVQHSLEMARYAAARISAHPDCELIRDPDLSVVLFRRRGWGHADYEAWSRTLLEAQRAFVTSSGWRGEIVGRLVFLHPATTTDMVDEVIDALD